MDELELPHITPTEHELAERELLARERALFEQTEHDLLDEPLLPLMGLSAGTMVAILVGGALGTVARYLLEAHHPLAPGDFPWVTLVVNLTGSFAIGLLLPLTEHLTHRVPDRPAARRRRLLGRMDHLLHARRRRRPPRPAR